MSKGKGPKKFKEWSKERQANYCKGLSQKWLAEHPDHVCHIPPFQKSRPKETGVGYGPDYKRLKVLAKEGRYVKAITTAEYEDGTKDLFVEVIQPNGKTKWEEFKRIFPIPDELKLKGLENREETDAPGNPKLLKGIAKNVREDNISASISSKNINPNFLAQIKQGMACLENTLTLDARWKLSEEIKECLKKNDFETARSHLLALIPSLFAYRTRMDQAILDLKVLDGEINDRPTLTAISDVQNYMEQRKAS